MPTTTQQRPYYDNQENSNTLKKTLTTSIICSYMFNNYNLAMTEIKGNPGIKICSAHSNFFFSKP